MLTILANKFDEYVKNNFNQVVVEAIVNGNIAPFNDLCASKDISIKKLNDEILEWRTKSHKDIYEFQNQEINKTYKKISERTIERDELMNKFMEARDVFTMLNYEISVDSITHFIVDKIVDENSKELSNINNNYRDVSKNKEEFAILNYDNYRLHVIESLQKQIKSITDNVNSTSNTIKKLEEEKKNLLDLIKNTTIIRADVVSLVGHNEINDFDRVKFIKISSDDGEQKISSKIEDALMNIMDYLESSMVNKDDYEKIQNISKRVEIHTLDKQEFNLSDSYIVKFTRVY